MDSAQIKRVLSKYYTNLRGWRTNRKIVVIESDDWGSIRMPSKEVYEKCLKAGYPVDQNPYERYDSLASEEDLELLFDLLTSFKDKKGNHPVFTANCVVANPDFKKIREDGFKKYHYELITETFKRYPKHGKNFDLWKQGLAEKIFFPQFHAREHLNVSLFMEALKRGDKDAHWGFNNEMPGSISKGKANSGNNFVEPTRYFSENDKIDKLNIFLEGIDLFEKLFGYVSRSIIPPNYTWTPDFDKPVFEKGVKYLQGTRKMNQPILVNKMLISKHYLGKKNQFGQTYLIRNVFFEPSIFNQKTHTPIERCLSEMTIAFQMKKPVVISSHRLNFIGFIEPTNRDRNLDYLKKLFSSILMRWPDVEFMTSDQLGDLIVA